MFQPLKNLLGGALKRKDVRDGVRAAVVIESAREAMEALFPPELLSRAEPKVFKDGVLIIGIQSPLVAAELKFRVPALLKLMNERFNEPVVRRIKVEFSRSRQDEEGMLR